MTDSPESLRDRTRREVRRQIAQAATGLFVQQGFEATTVDQIAAQTGISRRSFFRYFASKEDVVVGELADRGAIVAAALAERPAEESPWDAMKAALLELQASMRVSDEMELEFGRILYDTPSLRARHLEKQLSWQELLVPIMAERVRAADPDSAIEPELAAAAIVVASLTCLDVAGEHWIQQNGAVSLERLYDDAVAAVRS
ncbi:TetR/AcrR family transcriptional regulator [Brachybacterium sp. GCM10030267]|uniref:TetR/AcrR family transcriptional regulator n=1 Tax=unclassified Brachybacterium TaxID=2623841 RepID=UPI00360C3F2E